jgi:hypothetical protein
LTDLGLLKINNTGFKTEIDSIDDNYPKYVLSMDKFDFSREINGLMPQYSVLTMWSRSTIAAVKTGLLNISYHLLKAR